MKRVFLMLVCTFFAIGCVQATVLSEVSKDITHFFGDIKLGDRLAITNRYGNVEFRIHNKNEIKAYINVKAAATSKSTAMNVLNQVDVKVDIDKSWNSTTYLMKNTYYGSTDDNRKVEINIVVYIPKDLLAIKVKNEFGSVAIEEYTLPFEADVKFGDFTAARLMHNEQMPISVEYGKLQIDEAVDISAGVRFGEARIGRVENLFLNLQYSEGSVGDVSNLGLDLKHVSDLKIKSVGKVNVYGLSFSTLSIASLKNRFDCIGVGSHSNVKVVVPSSKKFEGIKMNFAYTPITILLPKDIVAQCNLSSNMGKVSINNLSGDNFENNSFEGKRYVGNLGKKRKNVDYDQFANINITNSFANIKVDVSD